jgi:transcriptional regulator with XRE-family HTH domain
VQKPREIEAPKTPELAPRSLTRTIGTNLRRLRTGRGLSLSQLARVSGVSRAMLGRVELGQSTPTVNVVSKIASALAVSFVSLMAEPDGDAAWDLAAALPADSMDRPKLGRAFASRRELLASAECWPGDPRALVFYEVRLAPNAAIGTGLDPAVGSENALVVEGRVAISLRDEKHELSVGDVIFFEADTPYEYRNDSAAPARLYVVMTHERAVRWPLV